MCSIAGVINGDKKDIKKLINSMSHRAPDDKGYYHDGNISLGMGRLKIIDLISKNLCPLIDEDLVLTYNGELYNFIELRNELIEKGWKFYTSSDTEVLMKSWKQWGLRMFQKLNGMYAFAIYDKKKQKIWLARDIPGEKPLYYYHYGKKFVFVSEAKSLNKILNMSKRKDKFYDAFQHCLHKTLWKNVYQVPAAHYIEYDIKKNQKRVVEYWKFQKRKIDLKNVEEELEELLVNSINLRLRSDVKYGLYYSKGIDSSLISTFHNFKYKFYFNDNKNWKKDFLNKIKKIAYHLDFPVGSLSSYPLWKLAEKATKNVKIVISGEGADEIFGGYIRYLPIAREWELRKKMPSYNYLFGKFYRPHLEAFSRITMRNKNYDFIKKIFQPYFENFDDPINAMGFADFKIVMPSLLQMGDRMASAFGLENRCPFLDKNLIEFGFSLPPEYKINGLEQKIILRNLLIKRGLLKPLKLEKKGLSIKFNEWFGRKDWNRSLYFDHLNKNWNKVHKQL